MTENQEFNAATVDEAVVKASKMLDIPAQELSYEILDNGSPGFLGIGSRDARITVNSENFEDVVEGSNEPRRSEQNTEENPETKTITTTGEDISAEAATPAKANQSSSLDSVDVPEDLLADIEDFTMQAVKGMGFEVRVDVYDAGESIAVDVSPGDPGLFIGQKGETIDAFQHLLNISTYKDRDFVKRITVDSEGYRQRRIEAVQGMAHRMARRATREGRTVELPPMSSSERRVVHTYLKENPKVSTDSEGTGENRRVNISPVS